MQASPLAIEYYYVESLRWQLSPDFVGDAKTELLRAEDVKCELQRADFETPRAAAFRLSLEVETLASQDYIWKIVLVGHFRLDESIPDEHAEKVLDANAPALLYSAAREALATSMARGPAQAPLLPSVNFLNFQRDAERDATASQKAIPSATPKKRATKTPSSTRSATRTKPQP